MMMVVRPSPHALRIQRDESVESHNDLCKWRTPENRAVLKVVVDDEQPDIDERRCKTARYTKEPREIANRHSNER